jgi:hypothetical protein
LVLLLSISIHQVIHIQGGAMVKKKGNGKTGIGKKVSKKSVKKKVKKTVKSVLCKSSKKKRQIYNKALKSQPKYLLQELQMVSLKALDVKFNPNVSDQNFQKSIANELAKRWPSMSSEERQEWIKEARFDNNLKKIASLAADNLLEQAMKKYNALDFKHAAELCTVADDSEKRDHILKKQHEIITKRLPGPLEENRLKAEEEPLLKRLTKNDWRRKNIENRSGEDIHE